MPADGDTRASTAVLADPPVIGRQLAALGYGLGTVLAHAAGAARPDLERYVPELIPAS